MTPALWATIFVAVIGVAGTLAAALLTQSKAARLEDERWVRQQEHEKVKDERERSREHEQWLRDTRHEVYGELIRASSRFFTNMPGTWLPDRLEDEHSEAYKARMHFFELLYRAGFLAGPELQSVIHRALDNTENAGHDPYGMGAEGAAFQREVFHEAYALTQALAQAARAELRLPAPLPRED